MVDMAHFAGLVAAGEHPSPVPHADVVTTTIHKTLGGLRGGMVTCREQFAKKVNMAVFPGQQGGPLYAHHRGQGRVAEDRGGPSCSASASAARAPVPRLSPGSCWRRASTSSRAARTCTSCSPTCATPSSPGPTPSND